MKVGRVVNRFRLIETGGRVRGDLGVILRDHL